MKSIQSKFLTIVISSILILAIIITAISILYMRKTLNTDSDIITESVANTEALRINDYLQDVSYTVMTMENYIRLTLRGNTDILKDESRRIEYEDTAKNAFYAPMQNLEGIVAFYLRFDPELVNNEYSGFYAGKTASSSTQFVEREPITLEGWTKEEWFDLPKASGLPTWLLPYTCHSSKIEIISYAIPIYIDHIFIGVAGVDVEFSKLTEMVSAISVYDNGFAYLTDSSDNLLFNPVTHDLLDRAATHNHGFAEEHKALDNGMTLVLHADYSDIQSDSYRMTMIIVAIVAVFLSAFIVITYILTKRIVRPLRDLTDAAEVLADGRTDLHLDGCKTKDEVGVLATAFEKTAEKLGGYMSYINALAYRDSLTGVKNRTAYNEISTELDLSIELGECEPFAVFVADVNGLKKTNDKYGHEVGNKLIVKSAKAICDSFKHSPVFRIGGDEFAVVLRGEDFDGRETLLSELDARCESSSVSVPDAEIEVSIARAIAVYESGLDTSFEDVFNRADKKMYEDKEEKRK